MSSVNELTAAVSEILIDEDTLQGRIAELGAELRDAALERVLVDEDLLDRGRELVDVAHSRSPVTASS